MIVEGFWNLGLLSAQYLAGCSVGAGKIKYLQEKQTRKVGLYGFIGKQRLYQVCLCDYFQLRICGSKISAYWDNQCQLAGTEKSAVNNKRLPLLHLNLLEIFSQGEHTEAVVERGAQLYLKMAA